MSGFMIAISLFPQENLPDLVPFAMRMSHEYRFNKVQKKNEDQIRIVSINNPQEHAIFENDRFLLFVYGKFFPEGKTSTLCEDFISALNTQTMDEAIGKLSGSYVIFIWDKLNQNYFVINDHIGSIPVYFLHHAEEILVSTEWKTFVGYQNFTPELNEESVLNTLLFGRVKFTTESFCKQCMTFSPGSILSISNNGCFSQHTYYKYRNNLSEDVKDFKDVVNSAAQEIRVLVNDHLDQYENPALFLSGGIDSRLLAAAISDNNKNKVTAVSFGMNGNDESFIAGEVASELKIKYINFDLTPQHFIDYASACANITEGQDLFAQGYLLYICDQLRRGWNIDAILDGMEIGVSLGGAYLKDEYRSIDNSNFPQIIFDQFYIHKATLEEVFVRDVSPVINHLIDQTLHDMSEVDQIYDRMDLLYIENYTREVMRLRHRIIRRSIPDIMITSDPRYLNLVSRIPLDQKMGRKFELAILEKLNPNLMNIRYHDTLMPLNVPPELWKRGKANINAQESLSQEIWRSQKVNIPFNHYFTNFSEWFRSNRLMRDFIGDALLADDCHLSRRFVKSKWMKNVISEHFDGVQDHRASISYLLSVELLLRRFNL